MSIYLGNLSIDEIEKRTGIVFSDEHKKYMNEHRQTAVNNTPLKEGFWHGFDIPFMIMTSDKAMAKKYVDMLSKYDWTKCKEPLRIGYERSKE